MRSPVARRWLSISLVALCAVPWALTLGVLGIWLLGGGGAGALAEPWIAISAGLAALCAGQLVLLLCVGDRLFPRAHAAVADGLRALLAVTFLGSAGVLAVAALVIGV